MSPYPTHAPPAQRPPPQRQQDGSGDGLLVAGGIALVALFALPAALLMLVGPAVIKRWPRAMAALAVVGAVLFGVITKPQLTTHWTATMATLRGMSGMGAKLGLLAGAAPWLWLCTLPLAPVAAYVYAWFRPRTMQEQHDEQQQRLAVRAQRQITRAQKDAAQAVIVAATADGPDAALIGIFLQGDPIFLLRRVKQQLSLNLATGAASLHMLFLGETGAGKSEAMFRMIASIAAATDWPIFYLDPKNDPKLRQRFYDLMAAHGRRARIFPLEDYNGWHGDRTPRL